MNKTAFNFSLGIKKVLQGLSFIKSKNNADDFKKELTRLLENSKIEHHKKYGYTVTLNTKAFYALRSASFGFTKLDNVKCLKDSVLKDLSGYKEYKKAMKENE